MFGVKISRDKQSKTARLYKKYGKHAKYYALNFLKDEGLAEDAVHDTFIRLMHNNLHKLDENNEYDTLGYILRVCRNVCCDIHNKKTNLNTDGDYVYQIYDDEYSSNPIHLVLQNEGIDTLKNYINTMKPIYSDVINFKYVNNLSYSEISNILGVSEATVRKRTERAKHKLMLILKEEGIL